MRIHDDRRLQQLRVDLSCVPLHSENGGCFFLVDHDSLGPGARLAGSLVLAKALRVALADLVPLLETNAWFGKTLSKRFKGVQKAAADVTLGRADSSARTKGGGCRSRSRSLEEARSLVARSGLELRHLLLFMS